jgi:iron-sulfur cluster assembly protein
LALALDEQRDNDSIHEISGYTFLVENDLINSAGAIKVDMTPYGFAVTSEVNLGGNGGGCSGSCSSC